MWFFTILTGKMEFCVRVIYFHSQENIVMYIHTKFDRDWLDNLASIGLKWENVVFHHFDREDGILRLIDMLSLAREYCNVYTHQI